jgi:hypothetical protein
MTPTCTALGTRCPHVAIGGDACQFPGVCQAQGGLVPAVATPATEGLTEEDIGAVRFFVKEKGDPARWVGWEKKKPLFARQFPELFAALDAVASARRLLDTVVDRMKL